MYSTETTQTYAKLYAAALTKLAGSYDVDLDKPPTESKEVPKDATSS